MGRSFAEMLRLALITATSRFRIENAVRDWADLLIQTFPGRQTTMPPGDSKVVA
jgi:hypothetical protein